MQILMQIDSAAHDSADIYVTPRFKTCPVLKPAGSYVAITDPKPNPNLSPAESHPGH